eukprot:CAMPEP_0117671508 /NCGR_PEP_ID=MMETSP0804-20121206/13372_1 /TAXON_ID=1074897 /ORGANISM="Tetraselmis astigmatica, Strain CCMP880" /LENGTH=384 /DNA_ID=CAMNT_0005479975 /DNA_START=276 /DNA_END=1430 /DNA_ORIENTATION=+
MVRGKLGLRIGSGKGDVAALCHPGEMLFCVVGVGSTRYRSAAVQPASPVWNEQFYFTVSNEAEVVLECWRGSSNGEFHIASGRTAISPMASNPSGSKYIDLYDSSSVERMKIDILYSFAPEGCLAAASSASEAPSLPAYPQTGGSNFSNPYGIPSGGPPFTSGSYPSSAAAVPAYPPTSQQDAYHALTSSAPAYPPTAAYTGTPLAASYPSSVGSAALGAGVATAAASAAGAHQYSSVPPTKVSPLEPGKAKMQTAPQAYHYAPPSVPAGYNPSTSYGGASSSLPPAGYPVAPGLAPGYHPGTSKPGKYKTGKYKPGLGMAAGGLALGALGGLAAGAMMSKGFGFKGPKGFFGLKGPKGFGMGKGFGMKGFGGKGFKGGFGWKD